MHEWLNLKLFKTMLLPFTLPVIPLFENFCTVGNQCIHIYQCNFSLNNISVNTTQFWILKLSINNLQVKSHVLLATD